MVVVDSQPALCVHPQTAPHKITVGARTGPAETEARRASVDVVGIQTEGGGAAGTARPSHSVLLARALAAGRMTLALTSGTVSRPCRVALTPVAVREAVVTAGAAVAGGTRETRSAPTRTSRMVTLIR